MVNCKMNRKRQIWVLGLALKCTLSSALLVICDWRYGICDLNALIYEMWSGGMANVPVKVQENDYRTKKIKTRPDDTQAAMPYCVVRPP